MTLPSGSFMQGGEAILVTKAVRRRFQWRAFAANLLLFSALAEVVSGVFLYTPGFIAHVIGFNFLGLNFRQWAIGHTVFGLVFLIAALWHVFYNWRPIVRYVTGQARVVLGHRRELLGSVLLALFFSVTSIANWPPSATIWDYRYTLREYWLNWGFSRMTVAELAGNTRVPVGKAVARLKKYGIEARPESNLAELVRNSQYTAYDLYLIVRGRRPETR